VGITSSGYNDIMKKTKNNTQSTSYSFQEMGDISSPDNRFRVALGASVKEFLNNKGFKVDGFKVFVSEEGEILLKPITKVPSAEVWIYEDPKKINALRQGVQDLENGKRSKPIKTAKQLDDFLDSL